MGVQRNGARTLLELMQHACKLTRLPGFTLGIKRILGDADGSSFLAVWEPCCVFVDFLIANDNVFNRKDATDENESEDGVPLG